MSKIKTVREKKSIALHSANPSSVSLERRELVFLYSVDQAIQFTEVHKILTLLLNSFDHENILGPKHAKLGEVLGSTPSFPLGLIGQCIIERNTYSYKHTSPAIS